MVVVEVFLVALVLFAVAAAMSGRGTRLAHFPADGVPRNLPDDRAIFPGDVERIRFDLAFRGYRMDEVDDVLDRLSGELAARDARIAELTGARNEHSDTAEVDTAAVDKAGSEQWPSSS